MSHQAYPVAPPWHSVPTPVPDLRGASDPRDLALPLRGATFGQAVSRSVRSIPRFSGRASRSEFWWSFLALIVALAPAVLLISGFLASQDLVVVVIGFVLVVVLGLISTAASASVLVRRLHDANISGWWACVGFVPTVGAAAILVLAIRPPNPAGARFDS